MQLVRQVKTHGETLYKFYDVNETIECDGSSVWADTRGRKVHVKDIEVVEYLDQPGVNKQVWVNHDSDWTIYSDAGFAKAIATMLDARVSFTEQGMQSDGCASMEIL